jgi:hypothetical protein
MTRSFRLRCFDTCSLSQFVWEKKVALGNNRASENDYRGRIHTIVRESRMRKADFWKHDDDDGKGRIEEAPNARDMKSKQNLALRRSRYIASRFTLSP